MCSETGSGSEIRSGSDTTGSETESGSNATFPALDGATAGDTELVFPAAAVLVILLYILLVHELLSQFIQREKPRDGFMAKGGSTLGYR